MKVVFLDVDGVLNSDAFADYMLSEKNFDIFREDTLDPRAIVQLKKIIEATGAKIVLSSSWRYEEETRNAVRRQLQEKGLDFVDTTTLQTDITLSRGKEIDLYLREHPEIEEYVILDDDYADSMPHHVKTTFKYGLTREKAEEAIKILKGEVNER